MHYYKDSSSGLHALSDDDIENGGVALLPVGCVEISQEDAIAILNPPVTLSQAQASQIALLDAAYAEAVQISVSFKTAAGITKTYQADDPGPLSSQGLLLKAFTGFNIIGATPTGFYWKSEDNTEVPFTLADLGGLYLAMLTQGNAAFNTRDRLKAEVNAAATVAEVQAIVWPA